MKKRVFYSFHYEADWPRASLVRNMGAIEGNRPASPNDWEAIKRGGDAAIKGWIDGQLAECCCTVVLIGQHTVERRWVRYEIERSWADGKGVLGIHIHRLRGLSGEYTLKGKSPFAKIKVPGVFSARKLGEIVRVYAPPYRASKKAYNYISDHISEWIEDAILIRSTWGLRDDIRECGRKIRGVVEDLFGGDDFC